MPRGIYLQPLELAPEWLTESPITADDLRCTTPASTIFRMSFGMSSVHNRKSILSISSDDDEHSDSSTFLWDDDSDTEDDADTIEESEPAPAVSKPAATPPAAVDIHLRAPSAEPSEHSKATTVRPVDMRTPWFMQVDPACLSALDNQLLQSPLDSFADLCYAQAIHAADMPAAETQAGPRYGYSWRRLSRLLSACPDLSQAAFALDLPKTGAGSERGSESESDTDSEQLASPEQLAPIWCNVRQAEGQYVESPHRPDASQTHIIAKPLPAIPSELSDSYKPASSYPLSPLSPSRALTEAQLSFLFMSPPPHPGESVHFFPTREQLQQQKKGRSRRGTLRISTTRAVAVDEDDGGGGATPWSPRRGFFQRGLAGIRAGLSH
ncbi:hypothetical protein C2E23DRAFT_856999 [Lenzites betulinus]|nr:hypothetical protein C2E23DRAFT_856999 [Lenzites betulinus]